MTAYLQLLQLLLVGCHVIFNTDKIGGHAHELGAFEGRKRGSVAHMQRTQPFHHPALGCAKLSFWICLPLCLLSAQAENEFRPRSSPLPREPQVPLPMAPQGPAALKHIYPRRPARADPES